MERLLIHQMAAAHEQYLRWQTIAVQRAETAAWRGEQDKQLEVRGMSLAQRVRYQEREG